MTNGQKVVEAAKKEGKLVIYTASIGSPFHKTVIKAFEAEVRHHRRACWRRAPARCASGCASSSRPAASWATSITTARTTTWLMTRDGNFQPHGAIPNVKNIVPPYEADDITIPGRGDQLRPAGQPQPGEAGRRAQELEGHPRSQVGRQDPVRRLSRAGRRCGVLRGHAEHLRPGVPREAGGAEAGRSRATSQNSERRVARGEYPLYIPFSLQDTNNLQGPAGEADRAGGRPALCPLRPQRCSRTRRIPTPRACS